MRSHLFLYLAQTRFFWRARTAFAGFRFSCYRNLYGIKHYIREGSTSTRSLLSLLKSTVGELALALGAAAVLQISNPYLVPRFAKWGLSIPQDSDYGTLLATVIGVGGVFIGLYYAAISAVGSAIYARVPNNIRDLLAREKVGGAYIRFVAVFTYFGTSLLAFHSLGLEPIALAVPLFLLGAGLAVFGFVRLGTRAFYLFDPTILSQRLFGELQKYYTQVQAGGYRWSDPSFQRHAHRRARNAIDALKTVADIAARETHLNGAPFVDLCKYLISFLVHYEVAKNSIPTESHWYEQKYVHRDWYRTNDTPTSMAHQTATGLQPQPAGDPEWMESAILPIVERCLEINIADGRFVMVNELLGCIDTYVQRLGEEGRVESALKVTDDVFTRCQDCMFEKGAASDGKDRLEHVGICDRLALMPISILLAYVRTHTIESYGLAAIHERLNRITWKSEKQIYQTGLPKLFLQKLEYLRPRLEFERKAEGRVVSPSWYLLEIVVQAGAENFVTTVRVFHDEIHKCYKRWIGRAKSSRRMWSLAAIVSREWEYWHKLGFHTDAMNRLWENLNSDKRIDDPPWPKFEIDTFVRTKDYYQKELLLFMAKQIIQMISLPRLESYPDFAGQFLHIVGEELLSAICKNDQDTVSAIFKHYFYSNLLMSQQLRSENEGDEQLDVRITAAPILDLLEISGYAYLFSEYYHSSRLKEPIEVEWNTYLNDTQSAKQRLDYIAAVLSFNRHPLLGPHRQMIRLGWEQTVSNHLRKLWSQDRNEYTSVGFPNLRTVVHHESPLVRVYVKSVQMEYGLGYGGADIFLAEYVRKRPEGQSLDLGDVLSKDFEEAIEKEAQHDVGFSNDR